MKIDFTQGIKDFTGKQLIDTDGTAITLGKIIIGVYLANRQGAYETAEKQYDIARRISVELDSNEPKEIEFKLQDIVDMQKSLQTSALPVQLKVAAVRILEPGSNLKEKKVEEKK